VLVTVARALSDAVPAEPYLAAHAATTSSAIPDKVVAPPEPGEIVTELAPTVKVTVSSTPKP